MKHGDRFIRLQNASIGRTLYSSTKAALYLLSSTSDLYGIACGCVTKTGVDFEQLKDKSKTMSGCVNQVIDIACNLYHQNDMQGITPCKIATLEYPYMTKVCEAIYIASDKCELDLFEDKNGNLYLTLDLSAYGMGNDDGVHSVTVVL